MNAAVWFGAAVFFTLSASPAMFSPEMRGLLGTRNFPYFSGAINQVLMAGYFKLNLVCGLIALAHLGMEWLYLSKLPGRLRAWLVMLLLLAALAQGYWLGGKLERLNTQAHAVNLTAAQRQQATSSLGTWRAVHRGFNFLVVIGLGFNLWRVGNPPDPTRFVSTTKFRS